MLKMRTVFFLYSTIILMAAGQWSLSPRLSGVFRFPSSVVIGQFGRILCFFFRGV